MPNQYGIAHTYILEAGGYFFYTYFWHMDFDMAAGRPLFVSYYVKPTIINLN